MDAAGEKLKRAFTGAFALLFAVIVLCAVFCNQNVFGTQSPRSLLAGGLALAVGVLCAAWLLRLLPAPGKRLRRTLLAAFFTLCFLAQAHVGRALVVGATGDWDFGIVLRAALDFAADGAQGGIYFNNFPNNQPLMLLLAGLFRLLRACGVTEEYELLVWGMRFGAVLLQLALFFLYLCAARLLGRRAGALALLLGAATEPFLLYAPVYYTDTVTAPIPIAILYCWLRLRAARREGRPGRGPLAAVFVLGVLGTLLKVTVVIMVIAVVLDWMISFPKLRERLAALALLAAVVAGVNAGSLAAAHSGAFRKAQPGDEIPKTHWIMMGLAGNGGYNNEDYVLTFSAPDGETRKALIRDEIAARLKEIRSFIRTGTEIIGNIKRCSFVVVTHHIFHILYGKFTVRLYEKRHRSICLSFYLRQIVIPITSKFIELPPPTGFAQTKGTEIKWRISLSKAEILVHTIEVTFLASEGNHIRRSDTVFFVVHVKLVDTGLIGMSRDTIIRYTYSHPDSTTYPRSLTDHFHNPDFIRIGNRK